MILVITHAERDKKTGCVQIIASHGIDLDTGHTIILSNERPETLGAVLDPELGEYVIRGAGERLRGSRKLAVSPRR